MSANVCLTISAVFCLGLQVGCSVPVKARGIRAADVGHPERTRITGMMEGGTSGITEARDLPSAVPKSAVLDSAILTKFSDGQACVEVTLRTDIERDVPLSEAVFKLNGKQAYAEGEMVRVEDFNFVTREEVLVADWVSPAGGGRLVQTKPQNNIFRTFVRKGTVCGLAAKKSVTIEVTLPQHTPGAETFGQAFRWNVQ